MKLRTGWTIGISVVVGLIAWTPAALAIPQPSGQLVESFSGHWVSQTAMPGVAIPDGARFTSTARMSSVAFEPGGMDFQGMIVDFNGKEQQFLQVIVNDTDDVTVSAGCNGVGVFAGALDATASHEGTGYQTGATFSADSHDVQVGSQVQTYVSIPSWHSMAVPELNGRFVEVMSQSKLDAVDAASGLTLGTSTGQIYVTDGGMARASVMPTAGRALLLLGVGLIGMLALRRRAKRYTNA